MTDTDLTAEAERLAADLEWARPLTGPARKSADTIIGTLRALTTRLAAGTARADAAEGEVARFREERSFVIGWTDGFEEGLRQAEELAREEEDSASDMYDDDPYRCGAAYGARGVADAIAALRQPTESGAGEGDTRGNQSTGESE